MGVWGYDALDSDAALDIQHLWEAKVEGWAIDRKWSPNDIAAYFINEHWGDAVRYGDNITNAEIIALVEIFRAMQYDIPVNLRKVAQDAINRELQADELEQWQEPEKRKSALLAVMDFIHGEVKKPRNVKLFNDPSIHYKSSATALQALERLTQFCCVKGGYWNQFYWVKQPSFPGITAAEKEKIKQINRSKLTLPDFMQTLDRFVNHGVWEKDSNISMQAREERLMMIAAYLGIAGGLSYDETMAIIKRMQK